MRFILTAERAPAPNHLLRSLLYAGLYVLAVALGRAIRIDETPVAIAWPAAGVAVLWLLGPRRRLAWRAADLTLLFILTVAGNRMTGAPLDVSVAFGVGNSAQAAVTSALLLTVRSGRENSRALRGMVRLAAAALIGSAVGAASGAITLAAIGDSVWPVDTVVWIFRNGVSAFVIVGTVVATRQSRNVSGKTAGISSVATLALLGLATAATLAIFVDSGGVPLAFAVVPASVLVGALCSVRAGTIHSIITWTIVVAGTLAGEGPFANYAPEAQVILVQAMALGIALLTLTIAFSRNEERLLQSKLGDEQAFVAALVGQLSTDLVIADEHGRLRQFDRITKTLAPPRDDLTPADWPSAFGLRTADGSRLLELNEVPLYRALQGATVGPTEVLSVRRDGTAQISTVTATPFHDSAGQSRGAVARVVDVTELREAEAEARGRTADLAAVSGVAHLLASETDLDAARRLICDAACTTSNASLSMLFEPTDDGLAMVCTAASGLAPKRAISVPLSGQSSGVAGAFTSGLQTFVADASTSPGLHHGLVAETGVASGLWQPVLKDGVAVAVLVVAWTTPIKALPSRTAEMLDLLASEAALAIDRASLIAQLNAISRTDPLTGAHNRRALTDRLADDLARSARSRHPLCLVMADLDHFKRYNDEFGHIHGDYLLKELVAGWNGELRVTDTLSRYGGEEFALVLPGCAAVEGAALAERLRMTIPRDQTASFGIAEWLPGEPVEALMQRADAALYRAKRGGRNRVESCTATLAALQSRPS